MKRYHLVKGVNTESFPNISGQELQAIAQMNAMRRLRHQVTLACCEHSRILAEVCRYVIPVVDYQTGISGAVAGQTTLLRVIRISE